MSAQPCGCDPEEKWICRNYPDCCYGQYVGARVGQQTALEFPIVIHGDTKCLVTGVTLNEALTKAQPAPVPNEHPCIQDLVIKDIEARKAIGRAKYGTLLQPFNGRDALVDAYQESLDMTQYLRQAIEERDHAARVTALGDPARGD